MSDTSGDTGSKIVTSQTISSGSGDRNGGPVTEIIEVTWTNLGPLTTRFRPPSTCSPIPPGALAIQDNRDPSGGILWAQCDIINSRGRTLLPWRDCEPSGPAFAALRTITTSDYRPYRSFYSPGILCPSGYFTADAFVLDAANVTTATIDAAALRIIGTHISCCPR